MVGELERHNKNIKNIRKKQQILGKLKKKNYNNNKKSHSRSKVNDAFYYKRTITL